MIYLNFNDLSEEKQEELKEIAREELLTEYTKQDAEDCGMDYEDFIEEKIGEKLLSMSHKGDFVFNI